MMRAIAAGGAAGSVVQELNVLRQPFLDAMSLTAATVTVVTTGGPAGRAGLTVSAMTPVSADGEAPKILICINDSSRAVAALFKNRAFCVNVLRDNQQMISDTFSGRVEKFRDDKFACAEWIETASGLPRLATALVSLDCSLAGHQRQGTHHVIFGHVRSIIQSVNGKPLVYCNRAYRSLTDKTP